MVGYNTWGMDCCCRVPGVVEEVEELGDRCAGADTAIDVGGRNG